MSKITISSIATQYRTIKKFEADKFLVKNGKYKYASSDHSTNQSDLIRSLFAFKSLKTILIAENYFAIEVEDEQNWLELEDQIVQTIQDSLNQGNKPVLEEQKFFPVDVYSEMDTGPGVLKFVCSKRLVLNRVQFNFNEDYSSSPMAVALFKFPYVKRVAFDKNFIQITKGGAVQWDEVMMELREFIRTYLMQSNLVMSNENL